VQAAVTNALSAQQSFMPGTNFKAWMSRILRNRFLSDMRRRRETVEVDEAPPRPSPAPPARRTASPCRSCATTSPACRPTSAWR
jgi:RNA polymerase sigma-70 factor (ECF subfamily)